MYIDVIAEIDLTKLKGVSQLQKVSPVTTGNGRHAATKVFNNKNMRFF